MFDSPQNERLDLIIYKFNSLDENSQDFVLQHLDLLIAYRKKRKEVRGYRSHTSDKILLDRLTQYTINLRLPKVCGLPTSPTMTYRHTTNNMILHFV
jgi:hypothetical protein